MEHSEAPLISIIVSCYNQEPFIAEAFDGIFSQSYRPLEIVFVDDRSTDRTADILSSRLAEHPERFDMRLLRGEANIGTRGNLHRGIAATTGRLIAVTCGDDVLAPNAIAEIAGVWQDEDVSLIAVNAEYIDDKSQPLGRTYREPDEPADDSFETLARDGVNACCFGPFLCFERELFDRFGWPEELEVFDVIAPFYAYLLKGARFISRPLLKYRIHGGNTSHSLIAEGFGGVPRLLVEEQIRDPHDDSCAACP